MFRQESTVVLVALTALCSFTLAVAVTGCGKEPQPSKQENAAEEVGAGGETVDLPREVTIELDGGVKLEMILIPAGEFEMGSPDTGSSVPSNEMPRHRVRITKPFYLGKSR